MLTYLCHNFEVTRWCQLLLHSFSLDERAWLTSQIFGYRLLSWDQINSWNWPFLDSQSSFLQWHGLPFSPFTCKVDTTPLVSKKIQALHCKTTYAKSYYCVQIISAHDILYGNVWQMYLFFWTGNYCLYTVGK